MIRDIVVRSLFVVLTLAIYIFAQQQAEPQLPLGTIIMERHIPIQLMFMACFGTFWATILISKPKKPFFNARVFDPVV